MNFKILPKIELHLHLDCSLSFPFVSRFQNLDYEAYRSRYVAPPKCADLNEYLQYAQRSVQLLQTKEALALATQDLFEQLKADNVLYAEIRFAPLEHRHLGLTGREVVQTVCDAVCKGVEQTGVQAGLILCTLRHYTEAASMETAELAVAFKQDKVAGFDLASDEAGFSIKNHIGAFQIAREHGLNCTAHAGEARGAESVWETLEYFSPKRIGHGVRSVEDPALLNHLRENNIHLEICPTSNIQTNVFTTLPDHPIDQLFNAGISLSINTDARTISDTTLSNEYEQLNRVFDWGETQLLACNLAAIEHAFTSPENKADLQRRILAGFGC